ncbi:MAG: PDZ domain-containing protein [Planctomycetaceae bacterium]|nr:PDZ domain-containing protein [Planctomycetaceae bacterium]
MKTLSATAVLILFCIMTSQLGAGHGKFSDFAPETIGDLKLDYSTSEVKANPDGRGLESFSYRLKGDRLLTFVVSWAQTADKGKEQYLLDFLTLDNERERILLSSTKQVKVSVIHSNQKSPISRDQAEKLAKSILARFEKIAMPWSPYFHPDEFPARIGHFSLDDWELKVPTSGDKILYHEVIFMYNDRDEGKIKDRYVLVVRWVEPKDTWKDEPLDEFAEWSFGNTKQARKILHAEKYVFGAYYHPDNKQITSKERQEFEDLLLKQIEKFSSLAKPRRENPTPESGIKVFLELADTGRQFTPNDTANLQVRMEGIDAFQMSRLKARIVIQGPLVDYTPKERERDIRFDSRKTTTPTPYMYLSRSPALWFGALSTSPEKRVLEQSLSINSSQLLKLATDDEMNYRFRDQLFFDHKLKRERKTKPEKEFQISLEDVFRVTITDGKKTVFDQRVPVTSKSLEPVIMYPDFSPLAPMPPGSSATERTYYRDGDPGWIQPGNDLIRGVAIRAACYRRAPEGQKRRGDPFGGTWIQYHGDPENRRMPEDVEEAVNNIAYYVFDSFFPKNWPEPIMLPVDHAKNLLTNDFGPGKFLNIDNEGVKNGFACIEHSYMFGTLVRALGIPTREVNNLQYFLPWPNPYQDASNEVYYKGRWNYFSLYPSGGAPLVVQSPQNPANTAPLIPPFVRTPGSTGPITSFEERYGGVNKLNYRFEGIRQFSSGFENNNEHLIDPSNVLLVHRFFPVFTVNTKVATAWQYEGKPLKNQEIVDIVRLPERFWEHSVITVHSPVVAKMVLADGKQVGAEKRIDPVTLDEHSIKQLQQSPEIHLDVKNSLYLPEGTLWSSPPSPHIAELPQTLIIPGDLVELGGKLMLKATGAGDYRVTVSHVNREGIQRFEEWRGKVAKVGELKEHPLDELIPVGERQTGSMDSVMNLSGDSPRPFFGIAGATHGLLLSEQYGIPFIPGLLVARVIPGTAAERAGLKPFDIVTELSGSRVESRTEFKQALRTRKIGDSVEVEFIREGRNYRKKLQLGPRVKPQTRRDEVTIDTQFTSTSDRQQALWETGARLTEVSYGNGHWMTVLRENVPHTFQSVGFYARLEELKKDADVYWKHGWSITDIAFTGESWSAVYSKGTDWGDQILILQSNVSRAGPEIEKYWDRDYRVTAIDHDLAGWVIIMTKNCRFGRQAYKSSRKWSEVQDWIRSQWDKDRRITEAAYHDGYWFLVASYKSSIPPQRWIKRGKLEDFKSRIEELLAEGDAISCLTGGKDGWLVITSKSNSVRSKNSKPQESVDPESVD